MSEQTPETQTETVEVSQPESAPVPADPTDAVTPTDTPTDTASDSQQPGGDGSADDGAAVFAAETSEPVVPSGQAQVPQQVPSDAPAPSEVAPTRPVAATEAEHLGGTSSLASDVAELKRMVTEIYDLVQHAAPAVRDTADAIKKDGIGSLFMSMFSGGHK